MNRIGYIISIRVVFHYPRCSCLNKFVRPYIARQSYLPLPLPAVPLLLSKYGNTQPHAHRCSVPVIHVCVEDFNLVISFISFFLFLPCVPLYVIVAFYERLKKD
jgi:hypothetical protein